MPTPPPTGWALRGWGYGETRCWTSGFVCGACAASESQVLAIPWLFLATLNINQSIFTFPFLPSYDLLPLLPPLTPLTLSYPLLPPLIPPTLSYPLLSLLLSLTPCCPLLALIITSVPLQTPLPSPWPPLGCSPQW